MKSRTRGGIFALTMAAALGFGAAQAFASPGAAEAERAGSGGQCRRDCIQRGYDGGFCDQGGCICIIQVSPEG
jgi:hypothetical protein